MQMVMKLLREIEHFYIRLSKANSTTTIGVFVGRSLTFFLLFFFYFFLFFYILYVDIAK